MYFIVKLMANVAQLTTKIFDFLLKNAKDTNFFINCWCGKWFLVSKKKNFSLLPLVKKKKIVVGSNKN